MAKIVGATDLRTRRSRHRKEHAVGPVLPVMASHRLAIGAGNTKPLSSRPFAKRHSAKSLASGEINLTARVSLFLVSFNLLSLEARSISSVCVVLRVRQRAPSRSTYVAADITVESPDFGHLQPVVEAVLRELDAANVTQWPEIV